MNPRLVLSSLLKEGFRGRRLRGAWTALNQKLVATHIEPISFDAFMGWYNGYTFPREATKQALLGDIVGGYIGAQVRNLQPPAFRYYAHTHHDHCEEETMSHSGHGLRKTRLFPRIAVKDESGRTTHQAVIVCSQCDERQTHLQRGALSSCEFFEKEGWLVTNNPTGDKCPKCRKVIKMSERKKGPEPQQDETVSAADGRQDRRQTGQDRLSIGLEINAKFDEEAARYMTGWSDVAIAKTLNMPVEWIRAEREHLFPGSNGDDPDISEFLVSLKAAQDFQATFEERATKFGNSVAAIDSLLKQVEEAQHAVRKEANGWREDSNKYREQLQHLVQIAENFPRPFDLKRPAAG